MCFMLLNQDKVGTRMFSYKIFENFCRVPTRTKITFCEISPKISHLEYQLLHNSNIKPALCGHLMPKMKSLRPSEAKIRKSSIRT